MTAISKVCFALACAISVGIAGCGAKRSVPPAPEPVQTASPDFLDLQPGWRLRITTPLSRHNAPATQEVSDAGTITLKAPEGFAYETSYYAIRRDPDRVLRFEFVSGAVTRDGKASNEPAQLGWRVEPNIDAPLARLIYLRRLSDSDHNMAFVSAPNATSLDTLTRMVDKNPDQACTSTADSFCAWVPAGVAVVAERMTTAGTWEPVR